MTDEQLIMAFDAEETKNETWRRLAKTRVKKALDRLRQLHTLNNQQRYEYTETEVRALFATIRTAVDEAETALFQTIKDDSAEDSFDPFAELDD